MERIREMLIKICDICKKGLDKDVRHYQISRSLAYGRGHGMEEIDICQDCLDGIVEKIEERKKIMNEPKYAMKVCDSCYYISPVGACDNSCSPRSWMQQVYGMPACPNYSEDV